MKTNLIFCGKCEARGIRQVLGEMDSEGNVAVMRFHKGFTLIAGASFSIYCGNCKEMVFQKIHQGGTIIKEKTASYDGTFQVNSP